VSVLRAGVLGLGAMGRNHARVLAGLEGVAFVGAFDPAPGVPSTVHDRPVFHELDDLIAAGIDYAVVAAPTAFHLDMAVRLAQAGVHALIEKPVASTVDDARTLRDLFSAQGLIGGVGHIERYNPALQSARQRIEEGLIGEIYQVVTRRQGPFPGRIADVGVIKDLASHDIAIFRIGRWLPVLPPEIVKRFCHWSPSRVSFPAWRRPLQITAAF